VEVSRAAQQQQVAAAEGLREEAEALRQQLAAREEAEGGAQASGEAALGTLRAALAQAQERAQQVRRRTALFSAALFGVSMMSRVAALGSLGPGRLGRKAKR
jgi:hypothetical protein